MILDKFLVTDQVAIVTASGRGIGAAAAIALAEAGADVVLAARPKSSWAKWRRRSRRQDGVPSWCPVT